MITFLPHEAPAAIPSLALLRTIPLLPLTGPDRCEDPIEAMAYDIEEIAASEGCAHEAALICRGWTSAQIIEYAPDAMDRVRGRRNG
jgi:hypothetical protein